MIASITPFTQTRSTVTVLRSVVEAQNGFEGTCATATLRRKTQATAERTTGRQEVFLIVFDFPVGIVMLIPHGGRQELIVFYFSARLKVKLGATPPLVD
jgi:hypothetical protein